MINRYKYVNTSIETLDPTENFRLYLTYCEGGKKPLLLGMHLAYKNIFITGSPQISNYFRSVFRKFGNEFLRKIAPNDYFSIREWTIDKVVHKSLFCKFIEDEKVFIDIVQAHAMTQAWDQLMNQYDLSRLFSSKNVLLTVRGPYGLQQSYGESNQLISDLKIPEVLDGFLNEIVDSERI